MLRPKLNRIWGGSTPSTRRDPGDAKYIQGWISEIPTFQVLNYLQYKMDTTMLAQAERGFFEWGGDVTYNKGALAWDEIDKQIYVSQVSNPSKTLAPSANASQWKLSSIQITRQEYDTLNTNITAHIANVTGNPHQLTAGRLNSYTKAETDALIAQYRALVKAHVDDKNNPHGTTAAQIGAVPITGGTYTGDVVFATGRILLDAAATNKVGLLSGSGVFLQSGTGVLGVNASGVAVAGTAANLSNIITEKTFADQKALVEPDYAVPAPDFYMPIQNDINIYVGSGFVTANFEPAYDTSGHMIMPLSLDCAIRKDAGLFVGNDDVTLAVDFMYVGTANSAANENTAVGTGPMAGRCRLYFRTNGFLNARAQVTALSSKSYADNKVHRAVMVRTATYTALYVDGILEQKVLGVNNPIVNTTLFINNSIPTALPTDPVVPMWNLRMWGTALTDKQVSNL